MQKKKKEKKEEEKKNKAAIDKALRTFKRRSHDRGNIKDEELFNNS